MSEYCAMAPTLQLILQLPLRALAQVKSCFAQARPLQSTAPILLRDCHPLILSSCHPILLRDCHPLILSSSHPILLRARMTEANPKAVGSALRLISNAEGAVLLHSSGGKDRTGIVCALLMALCDVPLEAIAADYVIVGDLNR